MANLVRLVYVSEAFVPFSPADLAALLATSRRNNAARGLSGLLLAAGGHFMQVLEGTPDAVAERFTVIAADPRHRRVHRILCEPTADRLFGQWTMALFDPATAAGPTFDRHQLRRLVERPDDATLSTNRTQVHKLLQNFHAQLTAAKAA